MNDIIFFCSWHLTCVPVSVFSQPIISKAKPQLLKTHFLPLMDKLKKVRMTSYIIIIIIIFIQAYENHALK